MASLKTISCVVFVALLCLSSSHLDVKAKEYFNYFQLVLMWPGSYCLQTKAGCCLPKSGAPALDFFVSGFQPYDSFSEPLTKCTNTSFNINALDGLKLRLNQYWSNIGCPNTDGKSLWRSAWKTYGVCSNLDIYRYFETALKLREKVHLLPTLLQNANIIPTTQYLYKLADIQSTIEESLGFSSVKIQCSKNKSGQWQLYRVYVCIKLDASTVIPCPEESSYFTCGEEISFPPFTYDMMKPPKKNSTIQMYTED